MPKQEIFGQRPKHLLPQATDRVLRRPRKWNQKFLWVGEGLRGKLDTPTPLVALTPKGCLSPTGA